MPAAGGPTAQSGIGYQNAIAALYLGRLCDLTPRPARDAVREVRVESPGPVDDIYVVLGDGSHRWMQAKERVSSSSVEWTELWRAMQVKHRELDIERGDRLVLWLGAPTKAQESLDEAARRAQHAHDANEWWSDLSDQQRRAVENVQKVLGTDEVERAETFQLFRLVDFEMISRQRLRRDWVPDWMPPARATSAEALYDVLQSKVSEGARYRRTFVTSELIADLRAQGIDLLSVVAGVDEYRASLMSATEWMSIPGTAFRGPTRQVFLTPRLRVWQEDRFGRTIDEDVIQEAGELVDAEGLPGGVGDRVVVVGGAGAGKSAFLWSVAHRQSASPWVPALVRLVELADSGRTVLAYLQDRINERHAVSIDWAALCNQGIALLLFDGLDELPQRLRSTTLDLIGEFSARFPRAPWIMTVREMAGTAAPPGARVVELQPLADDDIERFCLCWLPPERAFIATRIAAAVALSRELQRMARIPLLLALMAQHASTNDTPAPTRRSELLEHYLRTLLRPEKHKPSIIGVDSITLRTAAEALAFAALDARESDLAARVAAAVVPAPTQIALDALIGCGLLREQSDRYSFVLPIVQEYLAGHHIAVHRQDEIVARFEQEASRPWTQALQFALEVSDDAEPIALRLLATKDDAFKTKLKLLGRCVANGAKVSPKIRVRIGDELAARWIFENREGRKTGELLADAFGKSLPTAAIERLRADEQLDFGGAAMLTEANDPELTDAVLTATLGAAFPGHVYTWQRAIDQIAPRAAALYLARARNPKTDAAEREIHWLAYLLGRLPPVANSADPRTQTAADRDAHPFLRLACMLALERPLPGDAAPLVVDSFQRYVACETDAQSPAFDVVFEAMFNLPQGVETWRTCLALVERTPLFAKRDSWWLFGMSPEEAYWRPTVFSIVTRASTTDALSRVRELAAEEGLSSTRRDYLDLVLAFLGDAAAFSLLADRIESLRKQDVSKWLWLASRKPAEIVAAGLERLWRVPPTDRYELSGTLGFAFSYEVELDGLSGGARGKARRRHPASGAAIALLRRWADDAVRGSRERFACLAQVLNLGDALVAPELLRELDQRISDGPLDFDTDHAMSIALTALAEARITIPQELLLNAARVSDMTLRNRAYRHLELQRSSEALDHLLILHERANPSDRRLLAGHIERLAISLGVRIDATATGNLVRPCA